MSLWVTAEEPETVTFITDTEGVQVLTLTCGPVTSQGNVHCVMQLIKLYMQLVHHRWSVKLFNKGIKR